MRSTTQATGARRIWRHRCGASAVRSGRSDPARAFTAARSGLHGARHRRSARTRRPHLPNRRTRNVQRAGAVSLFAQPVVAQALMTRLLLAQHADAATVDRLTRTMLALRRNGSWAARVRMPPPWTRWSTSPRRPGLRPTSTPRQPLLQRPLLRSRSRTIALRQTTNVAAAGFRADKVPSLSRSRARTAALCRDLSLSPRRRAARATQRPAHHAHRSSGGTQRPRPMASRCSQPVNLHARKSSTSNSK